MTEKQYNVGYFDEPVDVDSYVEYDGNYMGTDEVVDHLNGLTAKNKVLRKEIERLKRQNEDILYNNAKNMELLEKENKELKSNNEKLIEMVQSYQKWSAERRGF